MAKIPLLVALIAGFVVRTGTVAMVTVGSEKRGLAVGHHHFLCDDLKAFPGVRWWYDWGLNLSYFHNHTNCTNIDKNGTSHIPMVWGWHPGQEIPYIPKTAKFVLGFNEPNHVEQSNLTAKAAAKYWRILEKGARGFSLVSPAAAPCGSKTGCHGNAVEWFDEFFQECTGCRIDYLATHAYFCDTNETITYLAKLFDRYGLKIWLTEFACPHTMSALKQLDYMSQILPWLEASPYIFRYSWYATRVIDSTGFVRSSASLLEPDSPTLTELGQFYVAFQMIDKVFGSVSVLGQYDTYRVKSFRNCQEANLCCETLDNKCYVPNARKMDGSIGKCYCDTKCLEMGDCCSDFQSHCEAKDCLMGEWSTWTECSNPCGKGSKQRKRAITQERAFGGKRCPGPRRQKTSCHGEFGCLQQSVEYSREEMMEVGYIMPANYSIFRISKDYSPQHDIRRNLFFKNFEDNIIPRKPVYRAYYRVTHANKACKQHPWAKVLEHGAEVCVECQPTSMNKRLERCRGHGVFREETMWKAIEVNHCHGKWKMITHHESDTCNHQGDHDFVLV